MISRVINKVKREINIYLSKVFKNKVSLSETVKSETRIIKLVDYYSFTNGKYVFKGASPYWTDFTNIKLRPLFIKELKNAEIVSNGVVINELGQVELESTIFQREYLDKLNCYHWIYYRKFFSESIIENGIVLSNYLERNYYHWILECIGRMTLVDHERLNEYKIILNSNPPQFAIDSLCDLFDIKSDNIIINKNMKLKVNNLSLVSFPITRDKTTALTNIYNPTVIRNINLLSKKKTTFSGVKQNFIISRRKATQRRIVNENMILDHFDDLKFKLVYLEDLTFKEQMQLFRNAGVVIATHGAGLVNLLFSENPFVVEFFPSNRDSRDAFYFYQISNSLDFNHHVFEFEPFNEAMDLLIDEKVISELDKVIREGDVEYTT